MDVTPLREQFGERLLLDEPLARHTSARIGGPADALLVARTAGDLRHAARLAWGQGLSLTVIGGGSNILISDLGIRGVTIINKADAVTIEGSTVTAESGLASIRLARLCEKHALTGFEWAIGVPGTLGGAVVGNAGAHGGDMGDSVLAVEAVIPGDAGIQTVTWSREQLAFAYRTSAIKREGRQCVITRVVMHFEPGDPAAIREKMAEFNAYRKRTQPPGATLGSTFKNPEGDYAGRLIDAAGLKGTRIGGAEISEKHANFFLNVDDASATDVMALIRHAQAVVRKEHGVTLHLEIEPVGEWPSLSSH